jgi:stearoyl-CoA desaturase (delta-9 desaturase)
LNNRENNGVIIGAMGEGYHNYHHTFPWDYRTSEFHSIVNLTSIFIEFFAKVGLAYDLKTVTPEIILKRKERTGDKE